MIDRRELAAALVRRDVSDWVIVEREQEIALVDEVTNLRRSERRTRWLLTVHVDVYSGRGSAQLAIDAVDGTAEEIVDQAVALAHAAVGPGWTNVAPAAPAKVNLIDVSLAADDLVQAAERVLHEVKRPSGATVGTRVTVMRESVATTTRTGSRAEWMASLVRCDGLVVAHDRSIEVLREARRVGDLDFDAGLATAASDLALVASAGAPPAGPCAVILDADAMLHGGLGVWAAFANQGDAIIERQGLTRYREHAPVAEGSDRQSEPLTVTSDGAIDFGVRSAPVGDEGDAIRKFALVERGLSAGLGLSPREAALRKREPNGGIRNLVVASGSWSAESATDAPRRIVEIRRLSNLAIDPYTGDASLEIALGIDRSTGKPFSGGTIRLDLIAALARARRSANRVSRGPYYGPSAVWIESADLI